MSIIATIAVAGIAGFVCAWIVSYWINKNE